MTKFEESLNKINEQITTLLTSNKDEKTIESCKEIKAQLTQMGEAHNEVIQSYGQMKDKYIESILKSGSSTPPKEGGEEQPRGLEEIANSIVNKDK